MMAVMNFMARVPLPGRRRVGGSRAGKHRTCQLKQSLPGQRLAPQWRHRPLQRWAGVVRDPEGLHSFEACRDGETAIEKCPELPQFSDASDRRSMRIIGGTGIGFSIFCYYNKFASPATPSSAPGHCSNEGWISGEPVKSSPAHTSRVSMTAGTTANCAS
jgi:hypothetical protein